MTREIELDLRKFVAPEFVFGAGAGNLAGRYAKNLGARRVLVVTDPGVSAAGWTNRVIRSLEEHDLAVALFCDVTPNPKAEEVMRGCEVYHAQRCNAIVAVGGGSPMDCAKGIGIVCSNGGHIVRYEGVDKIALPLPPLVFVPTTAGTSADVSQFAIITDSERKVKLAIVSKAIVPDVALIDPVTTTSMDRELTAHTGLDALCHAFEAYASNANSPVTDTHALESVRLIARSLPEAIEKPNDMQLRGRMMLASLFAGLAFSNASLGAVHAMAHSLGGLLDLPHGQCNAILLEHVVRYNWPFAEERYRVLAEAMGANVSAVDSEQAAETLLTALRVLRQRVGVTSSLGDLGMRAEHIHELAENALNDCCIVTNTAPLSLRDIEKIYERAL